MLTVARRPWGYCWYCAELRLDVGPQVTPQVWKNLIGARAKGMLQLFWSKGVMPEDSL